MRAAWAAAVKSYSGAIRVPQVERSHPELVRDVDAAFVLETLVDSDCLGPKNAETIFGETYKFHAGDPCVEGVQGLQDRQQLLEWVAGRDSTKCDDDLLTSYSGVRCDLWHLVQMKKIVCIEDRDPASLVGIGSSATSSRSTNSALQTENYRDVKETLRKQEFAKRGNAGVPLDLLVTMEATNAAVVAARQANARDVSGLYEVLPKTVTHHNQPVYRNYAKNLWLFYFNASRETKSNFRGWFISTVPSKQNLDTAVVATLKGKSLWTGHDDGSNPLPRVVDAQTWSFTCSSSSTPGGGGVQRQPAPLEIKPVPFFLWTLFHGRPSSNPSLNACGLPTTATIGDSGDPGRGDASSSSISGAQNSLISESEQRKREQGVCAVRLSKLREAWSRLTPEMTALTDENLREMMNGERVFLTASEASTGGPGAAAPKSATRRPRRYGGDGAHNTHMLEEGSEAIGSGGPATGGSSKGGGKRKGMSSAKGTAMGNRGTVRKR